MTFVTGGRPEAVRDRGESLYNVAASSSIPMDRLTITSVATRAGLPAVLLAVVAAVAVAERSADQTAAGAPSSANTNSPVRSVACLGQIVPGERVIKVGAPQFAVVRELKVRRGDDVRPGDPLALLRDHAVAEAAFVTAGRKVDLARARLEQVKAGEREEVVAAQTALVDARQADAVFVAARKKRLQQLYADGLISSDDYDEQEQRLAAADAQLRREQRLLDGFHTGRREDVAIAERELALALAARDEASAGRDAQVVRAPMAGAVLEIHAYAGERIGDAGLLDLADTARMMVRAEVYETDIARVRIGDRAAIRFSGLDRGFSGRVTEIQRQAAAGRLFPLDATAYSDRRVFVVHIRPDDPGALASFSNVHVTVTIGPS